MEQYPVTAEQLEFVEEMAHVFEQQGLFRMAGRVVAWLLICDPPDQTAGQLADVLQASKGSISAATRFLAPSGMVERFSRPGDRRDYFRVRPEVWSELGRRQATQYADTKKLAEKGLTLLDDATPARRKRLQEFHDFYDWLDRTMPALWDTWEREREVNRDRHGHSR